MASIQKRGDAYSIRVCVGRDVYGKQIWKTTTFTPPAGLTPKKRQKAVEVFAVEFEQKCRNGKLLDGEKITLKDFIERWRSERAEQELQPGTLDKYNDAINHFILPALGHLKLTEIKPHSINKFLVDLTKDGCRHDGKPGGYSKGTIHKISNVLSSILRTATDLLACVPILHAEAC